MKHSLKIITDDHLINKRAQEVVQELINQGNSHDDISRLTGCTILALVTPVSTLNRSHFKALSTHYHVSMLWLWTGYGKMFIDPSKLKFKIV
jgi:hypothetical protein